MLFDSNFELSATSQGYTPSLFPDYCHDVNKKCNGTSHSKVMSLNGACSLQAGVKGTAITFLMTDNQIVNEKFLVYINDLLSTGYIADLCTQEDKDTFCNSVRGEVKQAGMVDSTDNCWDFFIDKVNYVLRLHHPVLL